MLRGALTIHSYDSSENSIVGPSENHIKNAENLEKTKQGVGFEHRQSPAGATVRIDPHQSSPVRRIRIKKAATKVLTPADEPIVLHPSHGDLHEIYGSYDSPTVFFDILLPPYYTLTAGEKPVKRECHYYKRIDTIPISTFPDVGCSVPDCYPVLRPAAREVNIDPARTQSDAEDILRARTEGSFSQGIERDGEWINVKEIPTPSWFFSETLPYDGPKLEGEFTK